MTRPTIPDTLPFNERVDRVRDLLAEGNDPRHPRVVVRGNKLARFTEQGRLEKFGVPSLAYEIARHAAFTKSGRNGPAEIDPPTHVLAALLENDSKDYADLPRVDRVVDVPVLSASGRLVTEPGYHAEDGIYYQPAAGLEDVRAAVISDVDQIAAARSLILDDLFGDFDFADEASKANAVGLSFLPFVREFIGEHPTPAHWFDGRQPGVGKTYCAQAAMIPGCGMTPVQSAADGEEWRKRVTATLLEGRPAILLDNLTSLDSIAIAGMLTSYEWTDRVLGRSEMATLPNRAAWLMTGNNVSLSTELLHRTVTVQLDPGDREVARSRPKEAFRHADLHGWAVRNRGRLVSAYLTMILVWMQGIHPVQAGDGSVAVRQRTDHEGEPVAERTPRTMGSFERYAEVIGGILAAMDMPGFLANRERLLVEADDGAADDAAFLEAWHRLGRDPMEASELRELCRIGGELRPALPTDLADSHRLAKDLGNWLRDRRGARIGGYQLVKDKGRRARWWVRPIA